MEEADLYDDIFESSGDRKEDESGNLDDLYENIHIPQVAETAISKAKVLEEENLKLKSQTAQLKKQISILSNINSELKTANTNLQKNLNSLVETSRIEINRKKNEISEMRKELDSVLRNRAAKNLSKREIEEVLEKARPKEDPYFESRLPVKPPSSLAPTKMQSGIRVLVGETKDTKTVVNCKTPVVATVTNRQFVKKKKPLQLEKAEISIQGEGSAEKKNDISMISKYFGGRRGSKTTRKETGTAVEEKVLESDAAKEVEKDLPKKNDNPVVKDKKGSIEPVCRRTISNQDTSIPSLPKAASETNFKLVENASDEPQEKPSDQKTTEISRGRESLPRFDSAVCKERPTPTTDHLEKCEQTSDIGNSTEFVVKQAILSQPLAHDKTKTGDVEMARERLKLEQIDAKTNESEVEGGTFLPNDMALSTKKGKVKEPQMNQQDVDSTEDVISFTINSEDELDYEAEDDTEEEREPSKIEDKKPFVIPKNEKAKNTSFQPNDLPKKEKVADSRRPSDPNTKSDDKYRNKGQKDEERSRKSGPTTSRSRSPHRNRKRSRSRSRNRVEIPTKREVGSRGRRGRGEDVRRGTEERPSEPRFRKERDRERSPKKGTWSKEKGDRRRRKEDSLEDEKGNNKNEQRTKRVKLDRNGRTLETQEPNLKIKSESKLEELDDDDLLRLRKELLKQMNEEDLEKLEAANVEDGEISDDNDDEVTDSKQPKKSSFDLRAKLKRKSSDANENSANKNKDTGSDKENSIQKESKRRGAQRSLLKRTSQDEKEVLQDKVATRKESKYGVEKKHIDDQEVKDGGGERKGEKGTKAKEEEGDEEGMRPELLLGFSTEDIDHKLIPFKKRQFKQLQFEEIQLKAQIAARSASSTPVRSLSESSTEEKKVSPIKLSLKDVVIEPPSSSSDLPTSASSSSDHLGSTSLLESLPAPAAPTVPLPPNTDDNATFPQTLDNSLVFSDLQMTDESEAELSPVKRRSKADLHHKDNTSPQAISSLLRKPLVATSLLPKASEKREKSASPVKRRKKKFGRSTTQLSS